MSQVDLPREDHPLDSLLRNTPGERENAKKHCFWISSESEYIKIMIKLPGNHDENERNDRSRMGSWRCLGYVPRRML